jgi:hypothetical protein
MPDVNFAGDFRAVMAKARRISTGNLQTAREGAGGRAVAIVTPGRLVAPVPAPPANSVSPEMLAGVRGIVREHPKQDIVVIAYNDLVLQKAFSASAANALIPFLGYLMGMVFDGHTAVVFEGHPSALAAGCEGATLVLVDESMIRHLQPDWIPVVLKSMRFPQILVFGRDGSLRKMDASSVVAAALPAAPSRKKRRLWPFGKG